MKLWIDDLREPPDDSWAWVKSSGQARGAMVLCAKMRTPVTEISFDHDLGDDDTAMPVARMLEEGAHEGTLPPIKWHIHSANPVGRMNLKAALESADRYWSATVR